ncbi:hypothetical protein IJG79_01720 [Candidatus Saccharibacteria bacterium]|nr:hypothetical protein [Candidatus Saccharibacteria bacterium]
MTALGIIFIVLIAIVLFVLMFVGYLAGSSKGYYVEATKVFMWLLIITIPFGGAIGILFADTPGHFSSKETTYLLSVDQQTGLPMVSEDVNAGIYKFQFVDENGQEMSATADIAEADINYTDDHPSVLYREAMIRSKVFGRESVMRHYTFYLPSSMGGNDNTVSANTAQ